MPVSTRQVPSSALVDEDDRRRERRLQSALLPLTVGILVSLGFIGVLVLAYVVSGLPDLATGSTAWASEVDFPLIPLPSWLTVPVAVAPLLSAVLAWRLVDRRHATLLSDALLFSATLFLFLPILLALAFEEASPIRNGERAIGWHWLAVPLVLAGLLALLVRRVTLPPAPGYDSARISVMMPEKSIPTPGPSAKAR